MLSKVFAIICLLSIIFSIFSGTFALLSASAVKGAEKAVELTLALAGAMCFWCGIMRVLKAAGAVNALSKLLKPFMRLFFPTAFKTGRGSGEICACIAANMLGVGNAATPLALSAMKELQKDNENPQEATADQVTLAVMNTAAFSLVPSTVIALRSAAGSENPASVVLPVWICSFCSSLLGAVLARTLYTATRRIKKRRR